MQQLSPQQPLQLGDTRARNGGCHAQRAASCTDVQGLAGENEEVDMTGMTKRKLADLLNSTPETVSRAFRRLKNDNIILEDGKRVVITDSEAMRTSYIISCSS